MARRSRSRDVWGGRGNVVSARWRQLPLSRYVSKPFDFGRRLLSSEPRDYRYSLPNLARSVVARKLSVGPLRVKYIPRRVTPNLGIPYGSDRWQVLFDTPTVPRVRDLSVCARRRIRREVIHALNIAGQSGLGSPHYNLHSRVKC